ncbi:MAG: hypothetical protein M1819_005623 [Sarea resinae]|nr:MAG: hypothetical protein M1819_005623 [Sarea resinae]
MAPQLLPPSPGPARFICKTCARRLATSASTTVRTNTTGNPAPAPPSSSSTTTTSRTQKHTAPLPRAYLQLPPTALSHHWDTTPPSPAQLKRATRFFQQQAPSHLFSSSTFLRTPLTTSAPEVAFLGRSNVGKSSLLNALLGRKGLAYTSSKPGRTRCMNAFSVAGGRIVVLDMPGYGRGSREEWGREIVKYLLGRKQLRRVFLLSDPTHGLKPTDLSLLHLLQHNSIPHQLVLSKIDKVLYNKSSSSKTTPPSQQRWTANLARLQALFADLRPVVQPVGGSGGGGGSSSSSSSSSGGGGGAKKSQGTHGPPGALGEILGVSAEVGGPGGGEKLGVPNLRWAILQAVGLEAEVGGSGSSSGSGGGSGGKNVNSHHADEDDNDDDGIEKWGQGMLAGKD